MLLATAAGNLAQVRTLSICAIIIIVLYVLAQSFHVESRRIGQTTRQSLQAISQLAPEAWRYHGSRITKVTELFGVNNDLYEAAISNHKEHNKIHGYDVKVLRTEIVRKYFSKPTYLLSLVVAELAKTDDSRTQWLMWHGPDYMILNPRIPVEVFLPPNDFAKAHFLATQDAFGFDGGVFFMRVHEWTAKMLMEVMNIPENHPDVARADDKSQKAFEMVLRSDRFRESVVYQPRVWYNAYQVNASYFEGEPGDLAVHFPDIGGDKWSAMADVLARPKQWWKKWNVPLEQTTYAREIDDYWDRIRQAYRLFGIVQGRTEQPAVAEALRRLQYAVTYEMDVEDKIRPAIVGMQDALGLQGDDRILEPR